MRFSQAECGSKMVFWQGFPYGVAYCFLFKETTGGCCSLPSVYAPALGEDALWNWGKENDAPIGVFDSGLGGVNVLAALLRLLPAENYIFLAILPTIHMAINPWPR